jgi:hypothetical protein
LVGLDGDSRRGKIISSLRTARAIVFAQEIQIAIDLLPKEQREDARRLVSYRRSINRTVAYVPIALVMFAALPSILLCFVCLYLAIFCGMMVGATICIYALRTRRHLIQEMKAMVRADPEYWRPIIQALEEAAVRAGKRVGYWGSGLSQW